MTVRAESSPVGTQPWLYGLMQQLDTGTAFSNTRSKRPYVEDCAERGNKLARCDIVTQLLESLPYEIIINILRGVSRGDLIALASASRRLRNLFLPYLFAQSKVSWDDLISNWKNHQKPLLIDALQLIESLRLTGSCSKNEWTFPFAQLFSSSKLPNLKSLEIPTSGSTNFLKYSSNGSHLQTLKIRAVKSGSAFSLDHLRPFEQLKTLSIQDYEIESFDEDPEFCVMLHSLELINCSWCYPFVLENFGRKKIRDVVLSYSNAFIISERFKMFLANPQFENLNHLSIKNSATNLKLTLSVQIMKLIESIPSLVTLKLNGNIYNEALQDFTAYDIDNCINYVALNNVKVFYSSFFTK